MDEDSVATASELEGSSLAAAGKSRKRRILDSDGAEVTPGCVVSFSYGIPPVRVCAPVILRGNRLIAITEGHNPSECNAASLKGYVGDFWVEQQNWHVVQRRWQRHDEVSGRRARP